LSRGARAFVTGEKGHCVPWGGREDVDSQRGKPGRLEECSAEVGTKSRRKIFFFENRQARFARIIPSHGQNTAPWEVLEDIWRQRSTKEKRREKKPRRSLGKFYKTYSAVSVMGKKTPRLMILFSTSGIRGLS